MSDAAQRLQKSWFCQEGFEPAKIVFAASQQLPTGPSLVVLKTTTGQEQLLSLFVFEMDAQPQGVPFHDVANQALRLVNITLPPNLPAGTGILVYLELDENLTLSARAMTSDLCVGFLTVEVIDPMQAPAASGLIQISPAQSDANLPTTAAAVQLPEDGLLSNLYEPTQEGNEPTILPAARNRHRIPYRPKPIQVNTFEEQYRQGEYWKILGLKPGASAAQIRAGLEKQLAIRPYSKKELDEIEKVLLTQQMLYTAADRTRNQIQTRLVRQHGLRVLEFLGRQAIWERVWRTFLADPRANAGKLERQALVEYEARIQMLPGLTLTQAELKRRSVSRDQPKENCDVCRGDRELVCDACNGSGKSKITQEELRQQAINNQIKITAEVEETLGKLFDHLQTVGCNSCQGKGVIPCECVHQVHIFSIPKEVRPGWVLPLERQLLNGNSVTEGFVRLAFPGNDRNLLKRILG